MLQIYLYGENGSDFLDIDATVELSMESLSDLFDEDLTTGDFSIPIDIVWTEKNRRLFGFSERLENFSLRKREWKIDVYDNYFPELISAKLTILEKNGSFSYMRGKFSATVSGAKGLFGTLIRNKKLTDLSLGGTISWTGSVESRAFAEDVMKGNRPQFNYFGFAPIGWDGFFLTDRPDYDNEFLAKGTVNNVIASGSDWTFGRPQVSDPTLATDFTMPEHRDYRTIPFFKMKYVLNKIFAEHGFNIGGAFYNDPAFEDLYLFNNYAIEKYKFDEYLDYNRSIDPRNHVPDMLIKDFLKGLFTAFNAYPVFNGTSDVVLYYRKDRFKRKKIYNIDAICGKEFQSAYQNNETKEGFTLNYTWDSNDQYYSDRVKDLSDKTLQARVATRADLDSIPSGLTGDDIAYVISENMYYQVADGTSTPMKWDAYAEGLNEYKNGDGENSVDLGLSTLCQWVEFNNTTGLYELRNYLGTRQPGSYLGNKQRRVISKFDFRLFFISMKDVDGITIPVSYNNGFSKIVAGSLGIDDSYSESNYSITNAFISSSTVTNWGQSFISHGGELDKVAFYLRRSNSPTGNVYANIYAHTGTFGTSSIAIGSPLATSDPIDVATIDTLFHLQEFNFSGVNRINLSSGTPYVVVLTFSGGSLAGSHGIDLAIDDTNKTHAGNTVYYTSSWHSSVNDTPFYVYTIGTSEIKQAYSLALNGEDGIVAQFHKEWQQLKTKLEIAKTEIMVDEQVLKEMRDANVLERDNVQYALYKTESTVPKKKLMIVYLAPL